MQTRNLLDMSLPVETHRIVSYKAIFDDAMIQVNALSLTSYHSPSPCQYVHSAWADSPTYLIVPPLIWLIHSCVQHGVPGQIQDKVDRSAMAMYHEARTGRSRSLVRQVCRFA